MKAKELMTRDVKCCHPSDSLDLAAHEMWHGDVGAIPVVDDERRVVGMLTDRDVCMAAYTQGKRLAEISVFEVMAKVVFSCAPDDSADQIERLMRTYQIRRIPVVDAAGKLVGIATLSDLARHAHASRREKNDLTATLEAVSQPRHTPLGAVM